jgi:hypothetical protein
MGEYFLDSPMMLMIVAMWDILQGTNLREISWEGCVVNI